MSLLRLPVTLTNTVEVHNKWLEILKQAQDTVEEDAEYLHYAAKGMRLRERVLAPELIGRNYAKYCDLVNKLYDAYLNSVHLQRAPYMQEIITVCIKRMYELRAELTHVIVNDYIYVDGALTQMRLNPADIEIVVPYHFPLESRSENVEQALQKMWADAIKRKKKRERPKKAKPPPPVQRDSWLVPPAPTIAEEEATTAAEEESEEEEETPPPSVHTLIPEVFVQTLLIQRHERFRQWRMEDLRAQSAKRKAFHLERHPEAPVEMKMRACSLIQKVYGEYMKIKRERVKEAKRDILLGLIPDPFRTGRSFLEENNKVYEKRRQTRLKIKKTYLQELEKENIRLLTFRKGDQIDDITDEIREWFKEWFYGYNFFPEFPYEVEGGTILVVRGDFPTVEEQLVEDEKKLAEAKAKTPDQIKEEKAREKADAKLKAQMAKEAKKKEEQTMLKSRCNPFTDPGYKLQESDVVHELLETLRHYRCSWSLFDELPAEDHGEAIYGYMKPLLTQELMKEIHLDCRKYVDELMRLDLKMLIQVHQAEYKKIGWKYPKFKPRKKPKKHPVHKPLVFDEKLLKHSEGLFDLGIITKPTAKLHDIIGDSNYAAYEYNIKDPNATFPLPGFGDIRNRLMLSCIMGSGIQHGAPRRRAVMLLGPERNGKSFMADAVAGELNAIKIDITPEVFSAIVSRPAKMLNQAFTTARAFQPAVIFMKNVERVFTVKVPPEEKYLQAQALKGLLGKLVKQIPADDKVIFIATCSNPWVARSKPMVNIFDEILLVPRTDYGSLQQFFYQRLQSIKSIPRDYTVQALAQLLQGFNFGDIIQTYDEVMTPERIIRLNVEQLSPGEFLESLLRKDLEPLTLEEYQRYVNFFMQYSWLQDEREQYDKINFFRDDMYKKEAKKKEAEKAS